jgi:mRNA interferase MazF
VNRGEVWWVEHPDAGRRPACVLTRQAAIPVLSSVLVAPATRTVRGIPTEVTLTRADGMPDDCALSFDNLTTVPKSLLTRRITSVPDARLAALCDALRAATGC